MLTRCKNAGAARDSSHINFNKFADRAMKNNALIQPTGSKNGDESTVCHALGLNISPYIWTFGEWGSDYCDEKRRECFVLRYVLVG